MSLIYIYRGDAGPFFYIYNIFRIVKIAMNYGVKQRIRIEKIKY